MPISSFELCGEYDTLTKYRAAIPAEKCFYDVKITFRHPIHCAQQWTIR